MEDFEKKAIDRLARIEEKIEGMDTAQKLKAENAQLSRRESIIMGTFVAAVVSALIAIVSIFLAQG